MASRFARRYSSRRQSQSVCHNVASSAVPLSLVQKTQNAPSIAGSHVRQTHGMPFLQRHRARLEISCSPHWVCHGPLAEQAVSYRRSASSDKQGPQLNIERKFKAPRNVYLEALLWGAEAHTHTTEKQADRCANCNGLKGGSWVHLHSYAANGCGGTSSAPNERIPGIGSCWTSLVLVGFDAATEQMCTYHSTEFNLIFQF